jgi:branched-chain amino acid transport system ATP-binding protein
VTPTDLGRPNLAIAVDGLVAGYGDTVVLDGLSFELPRGGTLALLGRNGVGKSTLLATLMGLTTHRGGQIRLLGRHVDGESTQRRNRLGVGYVPQEREIFPSLTVEENLLVAAREQGWTLDEVFTVFPGLRARRTAWGGKLSGGEQQMLAIGRALVGGPKLLLLDEPMEGLAPVVVEALYAALATIRDRGDMAIVLAEQKADLALAFCGQAIVLSRGRIVHQGPAHRLIEDEGLKARLLGVGEEMR